MTIMIMIESGRPKRRVVVTVNISGAEGPRTHIWLYHTNHQSAVILMMIGIIYYVYYIDILIFIWLYHTKHQPA